MGKELRSLQLGMLLGLVVGLAVCTAAWRHNPQCAIHCDGTTDWDYLLQIWVGWFLVASTIGAVLVAISFRLWALMRGQENA